MSRAGWRLSVFPSLPSTSDHLRGLAEAGEAEGAAILAFQQTAGRGSRGRSWVAPAGNLNLSVLLRPDWPAGMNGVWALIAGLALQNALADYVPAPHGLHLKWPNDVLLDGRKCAGILIDADVSAGGRLRSMIIGFGANLVAAPAMPNRETACLAEAGRQPSPEQVAKQVLAGLDHWRSVAEHQGSPTIIESWMAQAQPIGTALTVTTGGVSAQGRFAGLDEHGILLLNTDAGRRTFSTGDVLTA